MVRGEGSEKKFWHLQCGIAQVNICHRLHVCACVRPTILHLFSRRALSEHLAEVPVQLSQRLVRHLLTARHSSQHIPPPALSLPLSPSPTSHYSITAPRTTEKTRTMRASTPFALMPHTRMKTLRQRCREKKKFLNPVFSTVRRRRQRRSVARGHACCVALTLNCRTDKMGLKKLDKAAIRATAAPGQVVSFRQIFRLMHVLDKRFVL